MNKTVKILEKPKGRRFVISDIHGCAKTLKALVEDKIQLTKEDWLFFLGDYIDKGPDSSGVIDYILSLQEKEFQIFTLMGNHEFNILETSEEYNPHMFRVFVERMNKCRGILDEEAKIKPQYLAFFQSLTYHFELEDFHLVHAGFDFRKEKPFEDYMAMLHIRRYPDNEAVLEGRKIVHGHQPTHLIDIQKSIEANASIIPLDNGCVYNRPRKGLDYTQLGHLCCLNLDSLELTLQKNIENH